MNLSRHIGKAALLAVTLTLSVPLFDSYFDGEVRAEAKKTAQFNRSLFGNYLAGRLARSKKDNHSAASFYNQALIRDPKNEAILKQAFVLEASAGNWQRAHNLARKIVKVDGEHRLAFLYLGLTTFSSGKYADAQRNFEKASKGPIGQLTGTLLQAWTKQAEGNLLASYAILDRLKKVEWTKFYRQYHHALIADVAGDAQTAQREYAKIFKKEPGTLRVALAYARHLAHEGKRKNALSVIEKHFAAVTTQHPLALSLRDQLKSGQAVKPLLSNSKDGIAEVYYGLGEALSNDDSLDIGLIYLQFALYMRPDFPLALAALANVYELTSQNARAIDTYSRIDPSSPLIMNVQIRKAYNLNLLDKVNEATSILVSLTKQYKNEIRPLDALGNIMRSHKRYREAVEYYDRAIALIDKTGRHHWSHYYSRGVSHERLKDWKKAEADLERALELNGDEPKILNYLGYSWIDQKRNLNRAMGMIRKAVKLKPDDGYYVDSLGWAYYQLGNYKAAVKYLERSVELRSDDPVINDHLGDALWRAGRRLEARFQWQQSLSLKPEAEDKPKIERKLLVGLPKIKRPRITKKRRVVKKKTDVKKKSTFQPFSQIE